MKHNWEYKRLGDVCDFIGGGTPAKSNEDYYSGNIPWATVRDMLTFTLSVTEFHISKEAVNNSATNILPKGMIVISTHVGLGKICELMQDTAINQDLKGISFFDSSVNKYFFVYWYRSISEYIISKARGATVKGVTLDFMRCLNIPLPPMEVQEQIVAELDQINDLIAKNRELLSQLDALSHSIFQSLIRPISEYVDLSYYVNQLVGGKSLAGKIPNKNTVLKSGAVTYDYFDKKSVKFLPLDYEPKQEHLVHKGDLLISRMNTAELVGACAYVFDVEDNCYLPDRLWRIEHKSNANPIFLWYCLISESAKDQIRTKASGTSGSMKNISKPLLLSIRIVKTPLSLQEEFAAKVEAIEAQKAKVEAEIAELQTLLDARMDYWFN